MKDLIEKIRKKIEKFDEVEYLSSLDKIKERYDNKTFKVAIVGEFSSGKSTLINALIGRDILLHATVETTATITNIYNVNNEDSGEISVRYVNGAIKKFNDRSSIKELTTTNSEIDVINKIDEVNIYTRFMDVEEQLVIIDTPGLNGTADKHREKTIGEIKNAHLCIFVFQKNGITDADREFIRFLMKYNNKFIFVLNFIDELRQSEGEDLEKKLKSLNKDIEKIIKENHLEIGYKTVGVSALKALVSKDKTIEKLYNDDFRVLTDDLRKNLYIESNFEQLEKEIRRVSNSKSNDEIKKSQLIYALCILLESIIKKEKKINDINSELIKEDISYKNIELAKKRKSEIVRKEKRIIEGLNNLIEIEFKKFNKLLVKDIEDNLEEINNHMEDLIGEEKNYDDFNKKYEEKFFSNKLKFEIDEYKLNLEINEELVIKEICTSVFKRLGEYVKNNNEMNFDEIDLINVNTEKLQTDLVKKRESINSIKMKIIEGNAEIKFIESENIKDEKKLEFYEGKKRNFDDEIKKIERKYQNDIKKMGNCPNTRTLYRTEVSYEKRGGFGFLDFFLGEKEVTREVPYEDDREKRAWLNNNRNLKIKINKEKTILNNQIEKINEEIIKYELLLEKNSRVQARINSKLINLKQQEKYKREEFLIYETKAKSEYLALRKKQLIEVINKYLFSDNEEKKSIKEIFEEKINLDFNSYEKKMKKKFVVEAKKYIKEEIKCLEALIIGNEKNLIEEYKFKELEIKKLIEIYEQLVGGNYESI